MIRIILKMNSALLPLCWDASGEHGHEIQQHVLLLCTVTAMLKRLKKKYSCLQSVSRVEPRAGLPCVSGGVYSQVVFLSCLYRNLWAPATGRQLPSGPHVDENYKQENWAASMLSTSFPSPTFLLPPSLQVHPKSLLQWNCPEKRKLSTCEALWKCSAWSDDSEHFCNIQMLMQNVTHSIPLEQTAI